MPWIEITCACGCERQRRVYHQPGRPRPKYFSRECARMPAMRTGNRKYTFTVEMDAAIRRVYLGTRWGRRLAALRGADPGFAAIPPYMIRYRARVLGVVGLAETRRWCRQEDAVLETFGGDLSVEQIRRKLAAAGYRRSLAAVGDRLFRAYRRSICGQTYTAVDVARMLGWEWGVVVRWIETGKLSGFRGGENGRRWRVHARDVAAFVRAEGRMLSQRLVDLERLVELLDEYPAVETRRARSRPA